MATKKSTKKKSGTPKRTRKAVGDVGRKVKKGVVIRRFTIGVATVLEEIDSPLVDGKKPERTIELLEGVYAMTHPAVDCQKLLAQGREVFKTAAIDWGDEISINECAEIAAACAQSIKNGCGVTGASGGSEGNAPSAATDG